MSEFDDDAVKQRAIRAQRELAETQNAFDVMRQSAIEAWLSSKPVEAEHREQLHRAVQTIDAVRAYLLQIVASAEVVDFAESLRTQGQ